MDELERSAQLLREALDELRKQGMVTAQTFAKLNQATNANTAAQQGQAKAIDDTEKGLKKLYDTTKQVIGGFLDTAQQARANREDFTSLNPAIRSTGVVFGKGAKTIGSAVSSLGDAISGAGLFFGPKGAAVGLIVGGLVKGLGTGIKAAGEETGKLLAEYGTFITGELQRTVTAFQQIASVGAIGAEGMQGFADMAVRSGLSMEQFSNIVARNGEALAATGGTTLQGAKALTGLTEASVKFEDQFLKMGIGFTEQRDFYAKFLNQNRLILRMQITDQDALAESAKRYIENIDELARLTGVQRSEVQAEIERQNADIRLQAQKQVAMARGGENLVKQIEGTVGYLEKRGGRTLSEGFADAMTNTATEASKAFAIATGGLGPQIARDLYNNRITQEEAISRVRMALDQNAALSPEIQARLGKLGTVYDSMYNDIFRLRSGVVQTAEGLEAAKKEQKGAQNAQDQLTDQTVKAQKNLQNFAQQLDKLVVSKILPNAATHVEMFTRALSGSINYINEQLGIKTTGGGGAGGGGRGGGGATGRGPGAPQAAITGPGGASRPSPEAAGTLGAIRDMIGQAESRGDYNVLVGGSKLPELTSMTIAQVLEYQKGMKARGHESSALGKYQITQATLMDLVRKMGIDPNTAKFDQSMQDRLADELIIYRGMYNKYAGGAISKERFMRNLSAIWAGLPMDASGRSFYQGVGSNKATMGWDQAMGSFAYGGITSGPRSGYTAMLHGTEAIVPLPGGRSIPVEMTGMTDKMGEQLDMMNQQISSLNELVGLMRTNNDINSKILRTSMN
jgi:muramidase (phage lysozyme)/23S rRNA pseudoU1915 N3-methylase RlmH